MENNPFIPEESDDQDSSQAARKRRGGDFLSQYLLRRRERIEGRETDSDEEESDEKPKKWRRLFSKIFPKVVERPDSEREPTGATGFDMETWLSWAGSSRQSDSEPSATAPELDTDPVVEGETSQVELPISTAATEVPGPHLEPLERSRHVHETNTPAEPQETRSIYNSNIVDNREAAGLNMGPSTESRIISSDMSPTSDREVIVERGGNALPVALVGVEYLARKRADRKLAQSVEQKVERSATNERARSSAVQNELETVIRQNKEQIELLKQSRDKQEVQPPVGEKMQYRPEVRPSVPEGPAPSKPEASYIQPPELRQETQPATPEVITKTTDQPMENRHVTQIQEVPGQSAEAMPRKAVERVENQAENNSPVERVYERSHEVKDKTVVTSGAASVGSVAASRITGAGLSTQGSLAPALAASRDSNLPISGSTNPSNDYRWAVTVGFLTAIVTIALGVVAYLMLK